ncbi:uncharacterized protein LOC135162607 [Diachasmimorpha longicaudata]|uniref:uncharacterized protein LOC135162607 n=1 Tax=Diachasmimorpha longicaudata TaxID=58733 RepID=UPI0030B9171E
MATLRSGAPPLTRTLETPTHQTPETSTREDSEELSLPPSPVPSMDIPTPRSLSGVEYAWAMPEMPEKVTVTLDKLGEWHYDAIFVTTDLMEVALRSGGRLPTNDGDIWFLKDERVKNITLGENQGVGPKGVICEFCPT